MVSNFARIGAAGVLCFGALSFAPRADAGILNDILSIITTAKENATDARTRAGEARDRANELRNDQRNRLALLTDEMQTAIDEAVEDLQLLIDIVNEGRDEFVADGGCSVDVCEPFRQDLIRLLENIETVLNLLFEIGGVTSGPEIGRRNPGPADFQKLIGLTQNLPGRALFPLHQALVTDGNVFEGGLLDRLAEASDHLRVMRDALAQDQSPATGSGETNHLEEEEARCASWDEHQQAIKVAYAAVGGVALASKLVGKGLDGAGSVELGALGGVGTVEVEMTSSPLRRLGKVLGKAADVMFWGVQMVSGKRLYCLQIVVQGNVRDAVGHAAADLLARQALIRDEQDATLGIQQTTLDILNGVK